MVENKALPKLPKLWKRQFLKALKSGCYAFCTGNWYKKVYRTNKKGEKIEYAYCTLGAAYHFSTGKNEGSEGWRKKGVPEAFLDSGVRSTIMNLNDRSRSFKPTIKWIEENL